MPRLRGRSHFGAAKAHCSTAGLDFTIIPVGFNTPLEFLTGLLKGVNGYPFFCFIWMPTEKIDGERGGRLRRVLLERGDE